MKIRAYVETDAQATLGVFLSAVSETASAHYSAKQIAVWSRPQERELGAWNSARTSNTFVATIGIEVVGFSDVSDDGHIDMMFVAPKFGRRGVASALLAHLCGIAEAAGTAGTVHGREHHRASVLRTARIHRRRRAAPE